MTSTKLEHARNNAERALAQLLSFLSVPATTDRDIAGIIQAFELTFEATWKFLQKLVESDGIPAPSPKKAIAAAFRLGICTPERVWIDMLEDRNLTTHTYNKPVADRIYTHVRDVYANALADTLKRAVKRP